MKYIRPDSAPMLSHNHNNSMTSLNYENFFT